MPSEKSFQNEFMKKAKHAYRTSLTNGGGFPDVLMVNGAWHSLIELKLLHVGPSGDKKLKGLFKPSQRPWYANYVYKGGKRLFIVFKLNRGYGALLVTKAVVDALPTMTYKDLPKHNYWEYSTLTALIEENFA